METKCRHPPPTTHHPPPAIRHSPPAIRHPPPAARRPPPTMQVTFVQYVPAHLKIGVPHPDPVVENASLSAVRPPAITYELRLARKVIEKGYLSDLQLESLVYAAQQHEKFDGEKRKGFFIGDGAGVGKGRQLAGRFDRGGMLLCRSMHYLYSYSVDHRDHHGECPPRPAQAHLGIGFQ